MGSTTWSRRSLNMRVDTVVTMSLRDSSSVSAELIMLEAVTLQTSRFARSWWGVDLTLLVTQLVRWSVDFSVFRYFFPRERMIEAVGKVASKRDPSQSTIESRPQDLQRGCPLLFLLNFLERHFPQHEK